MHLKQALRNQMIAQRDQLTSVQQQAHAQQIKQFLIQKDYYRQAQQVAFYASFGGEVLTKPLIEEALIHQKNCYLPILRINHLEFIKIAADTPLHKNCYEIFEPAPETGFSIMASQLDLVLLPLVAFDSYGHRLGMGKGYYDITFAFRRNATKPRLIGLAHECQRQRYVPNNDLDILLDEIITERGCYPIK